MHWLEAPGIGDDKYRRGVLAAVVGSARYPGAAVLVAEAAWRTGVGMVRLGAPERVQDLVLARRPETIVADPHELGRHTAAVLGSGIDPGERGAPLLEQFAAICDAEHPVVLDAGALDHAMRVRGRAFATPHAGELSRMLGWLGQPHDRGDVEAEPREKALAVAEQTGAIIVLKGHTTWVAAPDGTSVSVTAPTTRLATAGTGDVLAGILGGLVARHRDRVDRYEDAVALAATAVRVHGAAAALLGERPVVALEVATAVSEAVARLS